MIFQTTKDHQNYLTNLCAGFMIITSMIKQKLFDPKRERMKNLKII